MTAIAMAGIEPKHLDFAGRRALVTGAAGGLAGPATRQTLIADGGYILV